MISDILKGTPSSMLEIRHKPLAPYTPNPTEGKQDLATPALNPTPYTPKLFELKSSPRVVSRNGPPHASQRLRSVSGRGQLGG